MRNMLFYNMKIFLGLSMLLALSIGCAMCQTLHGARAQGMGGAFAAISDDPAALSWNPAGLDLFPQNSFVSHFTTMYCGFSDDALGTGALGYVHHLPGYLSLGLSADMLYSDIYRRNIIALSVGRKLGQKVSFGIRSKFFISNFMCENFVYGEDDVVDDPFFDKYGYSANSLGLDIGAIAEPIHNFTFGIFVRNAIAPDLALSSIASKSPMKARLGVAYKLHGKYTFSLEGEYSSESIDDKALNYFIGVETWQFSNKIGLRSGLNSDQLSFGASYRNPALLYFGIDYTFIYPLSRIGEEVPASHKTSLSLGFIPRKPEVVEITEVIELDTIVVDTIPLIPAEPIVAIKVTPDVLFISEVTQIYEEEPLVPVIFFDEGSAIVDDRFDQLIFTIGERIANNNDVVLKLYGYYDTRSEVNEDNLSYRRALAVQKRFAELVPEAVSRIEVVGDGYSIAHERAGLGREAPSHEQQIMINQENRRVEFNLEITACIADGMEFDCRITTTEPDKVAQLFNPILLRNPDIDVIIEGGGSKDNFVKAFEFETKLAGKIDREYRNRLFVSLSGTGTKLIKLNADGIIFRPRQVRSTLEFTEIEKPAIIDIDYTVPGGFMEYTIDIIELDGDVFHVIETGSGNPTNRLSWNWTDSEGNLVDVRGKYFARITGTDTLGRNVTAVSEDTLRVLVTEREIVRAKLLIVQFIYDEDAAQSIYLEDRLEYITRKLLVFAQEPDKKLTVEIEGHTDVLGIIRRNMELSSQRASAEFDNIKEYLIQMLGLSGRPQLVRWFLDKNVTIEYKGYGPNSPYNINRWTGGEMGEVLLGDNSLPEGRTINRRVVITMELVKMKQ